MGMILIGIILIALAFSIKILLGFKIEQSLFLTVCSIILLQFLFGIMGSVELGYYFTIALSFVLFAASLVFLVVSKKRRSAFSIKDYLTPGTVAFFLACSVYCVFMRGEIMAITDAAVHWGYATRWMYETGRIYLGVQTLSVPLLNYFLIKTAGYAESYFFLGRWMVMWAAIILPLSDVKWNKWYKALMYTIMAYMILGVIDPVPKMFMDLPLGVFAGALCALLAVSKARPKEMITAAIGAVVLGNIKNGSGLLFSVFVFGFAAIVYFANNKSDRKKREIFYLLGFVPALAAAELFRRITHESNIKDNAEPGMVIPLDLQEIAAKLTTNTMLLLYAVTALSVAVFIFFAVKSKRKDTKGGTLNKFVLAVICLFAALTLYKAYSGFFSALTHKDQVILIEFWESYSIKGYFGWQIRNLFGMLAAFAVACGLLCVKKEYIKSFWSQTLYMALATLFYAFALIIIYLHSFIEMEAAGYAAMHRYIGSSIVFASIWITGYIVLSEGIWKAEKRQIIAAVLLLAFLSRETPPIGTVYNYGLRGEAGVHLSVMDKATFIKSNTDADDKIYFISQDYDNSTYLDDWSANAWLRYEIAPRYLNWVFWSLGDSYKDVDPSTTNVDSDGFRDILLSDGYDYVYLYDADDFFWERYGNLFTQNAKDRGETLFKVSSSGSFLLEPVD